MGGDPAVWVRVGTVVELVLAAVTAGVLAFVVAPYGRHARAGWGPTLPNRMAWVLMEAPAPLGFLAWYLAGQHATAPVPLILLALWQLHYVHRTFVFPFRLRTEGKRMPVVVVAAGFVFNLLNAWINATWVSTVGEYGSEGWADPRLLAGAGVLLTGFTINVWADDRLLALRAGGATGYHLPRGGLFELVSCPNYLGELTVWLGWAIATGSPPGLAFLAYTTANLVPRALQHHAWYRRTFTDYPPGRRAIVPFVL
jgi:protein-S-isoprenylcysteine O-methyltransferase Ste14